MITSNHQYNSFNTMKRCKPLLGTYIEIFIEANLNDAALLELTEIAFNEIRRIEAMMNFYDDQSELSYINKNAFWKTCDISNELYTIISYALELSHKTNGLFDISIGSYVNKNDRNNIIEATSGNWNDIELLNTNTITFHKNLQIDLGGIAKGYAVDQAFKKISSETHDLIINAGGDLRHKLWKNETILVQTSETQTTQITMQADSLATSSWYYQDNKQAAIIHPFNRLQTSKKHTISVFAEDCMVADALTKVCFLMNSPQEVLKHYRANAVMFDKYLNKTRV